MCDIQKVQCEVTYSYTIENTEHDGRLKPY